MKAPTPSMIAASILELAQRSQGNLIWLKAGHKDPSVDRNLDKRVAELEGNFQELLKLLQFIHPVAATQEEPLPQELQSIIDTQLKPKGVTYTLTQCNVCFGRDGNHREPCVK